MTEKRRRNLITKTNLRRICIVVSILCILFFILFLYLAYNVILFLRAPYSTPHGGKHHADNCWVPRGRESCAPSYIIAGAMKCGTTSLFSYLNKHPEILSLRSFVLDPSNPSHVTAEKEIRYFIDPMWSNLKFKYGQDRSVEMYLDLFEEIPSPYQVPHPDPDVEKNRGKITGEATPMYICQPGVAHRVVDILPKVKVILMLRHPVDRSYSEFWFKRALSGKDQKNTTQNIAEKAREESLLQHSFIQCTRNDLALMKHCLIDDLLQNPSVIRANEFAYCYMNISQTIRSANPIVDPICEEGSPISHLCLPPMIRRNCPPSLAINSLYAWQISEWLEVFPMGDQLMIIQSEIFYNNTNEEMKKVEQFLNISPIDWSDITTKKYNIVNPNSKDNNNNNKDNKDINGESKKDAGLKIQDKSNDYPELDPALYAALAADFEPYNQILYRLLNSPSMW